MGFQFNIILHKSKERCEMIEVRREIFGNKKPDFLQSGFEDIYDKVVWSLGRSYSIFSSSPVNVK